MISNLPYVDGFQLNTNNPPPLSFAILASVLFSIEIVPPCCLIIVNSVPGGALSGKENVW